MKSIILKISFIFLTNFLTPISYAQNNKKEDSALDEAEKKKIENLLKETQALLNKSLHEHKNTLEKAKKVLSDKKLRQEFFAAIADKKSLSLCTILLIVIPLLWSIVFIIFLRRRFNSILGSLLKWTLYPLLIFTCQFLAAFLCFPNLFREIYRVLFQQYISSYTNSTKIIDCLGLRKKKNLSYVLGILMNKQKIVLKFFRQVLSLSKSYDYLKRA